MKRVALRLRSRSTRVPAGTHGTEHAVFLALLRAKRIPAPTPEHRFAPPRRWRFDYAWPDHRIALEVQGGLFTRGRHTRGPALLLEHEKLNVAALQGWRLLYTIPDRLCSDSTVSLLAQLLAP